MLKLENNCPSVGTRFSLPATWHDKILKFSKLRSFPHQFIIDSVVFINERRENYFVCKSINKSNANSATIALTEVVIKYLFAEEVPDSNVGLYLDEYLPKEDTEILITNVRSPSEVVLIKTSVQPELEVVRGKSMICFDYAFDYINGVGHTSIKHFIYSSNKYTWKFLKHPDISYMTDYEKIFQDTIIHKEYVVISCNKLATYLEKEGAVTHAKLLRERGAVHDNSKISNIDEMMALSRIINDKSSLKDSSKKLSRIEKDAIRIHWSNNSHHPEHFKSVIDMSKLDIMEMCCDWYARSMQYGSDFLSFVKQRQEERFHFPDWMFAEIWHYCKILNSSDESLPK